MTPSRTSAARAAFCRGCGARRGLDVTFCERRSVPKIAGMLTRRVAWILALVLSFHVQGATARLPVRRYTSADGLAQDEILRMAFDADGFLWTVTSGGLSRFDGERFTNYGKGDGLRGRAINDIAVGRDGIHWLATTAGLFAFRPGEISPQNRLFQEVPLDGASEGDQPYRLLADRSGALWVGTLESLWRVTVAGDGYRATHVELHPKGAEPFSS